MYVLIQGGVLDVKKSGQGTLPDAGTFLGCRKVGFWFPLARKKLEIHFSTPEAGLSGQKPIKRNQKYVVLGVFGHFPKISKCPYAKNVIDTAFSFEDRRSGTTMFFGCVGFQPRASETPNFPPSKRPLLNTGSSV
jgi:hypothetical protein